MSGVTPARGGADKGAPGTLEAEGDGACLTFRRWLGHPVEVVWEAITEPRAISKWFMAEVRREPGVGGRLEMEHPNGVHATGRVLEWRPPSAYEYEWNLPPSPGQPGGERSIVRWELSPSGAGTLLIMTHRRLSRPTAEIFVRGMRVLLDRLAAQLDGTELPAPPWVRPAANSSASR